MSHDSPFRLLLLCGSLRRGSVNGAVLSTAAALAPDGVAVEEYDGQARLPHFNPDDDPEGPARHPEVAALRAALARADALLVCTPEYAGTLPGPFANLLDWTVGGMEVEGLPTGWINASPREGGAAGAHAALAALLGYTGAADVPGARVHVPVRRDAIGADGTVDDPVARAAIAEVVARLVATTRARA